MAQTFFTPANSATLTASATSANVALPSGGTTLWIFNSGISPIAFLLSASGSTVVTPDNGMSIAPGQGQFIGAGSNTRIAIINTDGSPLGSRVSITAGT